MSRITVTPISSVRRDELIVSVAAQGNLASYEGTSGYYRGLVYVQVLDNRVLVKIESQAGPVMVEALQELFSHDAVSQWFTRGGLLRPEASMLIMQLPDSCLEVIERTPESMRLS